MLWQSTLGCFMYLHIPSLECHAYVADLAKCAVCTEPCCYVEETLLTPVTVDNAVYLPIVTIQQRSEGGNDDILLEMTTF